MCCSFYWYLPTIKSISTGYPGVTTTFPHSMVLVIINSVQQCRPLQVKFWQGKVTRSIWNQFQNMKLHQYFLLTILKLQHILCTKYAFWYMIIVFESMSSPLGAPICHIFCTFFARQKWCHRKSKHAKKVCKKRGIYGHLRDY